MKFLMLRGQVPQDRNAKEIMFDKREDIDDVWSQLFFAMLEDNDSSELWYWGGKRTKKFTENFTERWVPFFENYETEFVPDVIFCRGGFQEYHTILKRFPKAVKIYYGAGNRFLPQPGFHDYDIILQDSPEQVEICKAQFPKALTTLYVKPAADNVFYPIDCKKDFDVCFPANASQSFKGHNFVYSTVPKNIKLLNLGNRPKRYAHGDNVTSLRSSRTGMAKNISRCKVGIVAVNSRVDSCPRVIPEMLACGIPIIVLDDVRFWQSKYIVSANNSWADDATDKLTNKKNFWSTIIRFWQNRYVVSVADSCTKDATGELTSQENFWSTVEMVLNHLEYYNPRKYYEENLSLDHAGKFIREKIDEISV
ncbi:hypothetical protein LCGC14_0530230 [marine sediment metagenome]|uniref:Exostosin GT47 domain-containing protein n=1 Tax=marine sediment metagenome TaxID=412755 RepID=A0A0F9V3W6_9ZZZZ